MICYQCGEEAGERNQCPACKADLRVFRKIHQISNEYYNDGLEKAKLRDLSGAADSFRRSVKFNKYHTDARNMLGLVYYETGQIVDAIMEWVISKNLCPEQNIAEKYLDTLQKSRSRLEHIRNTARKFNKALFYCHQEDYDLAVLQLKKVLSMNPRNVKAYQLIALLYMREDKLDQAGKALHAAAKIDLGNTTTSRYQKELNELLNEKKPGRRKKDDLISYRSGNDTIIMPKRFRETSVGMTLLSILIGLVIGAATVGFLIVPEIKSKAMREKNQEVLKVTDELYLRNEKIKELDKTIQDLQKQIKEAGTNQELSQTALENREYLLLAYTSFHNGNRADAEALMGRIQEESLSEASITALQTLRTAIKEKEIEDFYQAGYQAYDGKDYAAAVENLKKVTDEKPDYRDGDAVFYLAESYRLGADEEAAKPYYQYIVEHYPDSQHAKAAKEYLP